MRHSLSFAAACLSLAACAAPIPESMPTMPETTVPAFDYDSVFVHDGRPEDDFEQYELRNSRQILAFTGVMPGMTVLDMEAGGGIYTELFSLVVGEEGKVYLQNPPEFETFLGDAVEKRMDGRLINVTHIQTSFDDFEPIGDMEVDLVTWFLGPHELWYTPEGAEPGALGDPDVAFSEIARVLKPGGHFVVIDHRAPDGACPRALRDRRQQRRRSGRVPRHRNTYGGARRGYQPRALHPIPRPGAHTGAGRTHDAAGAGFQLLRRLT